MTRVSKKTKKETMADRFRYLGDVSRCSLLLLLQEQKAGLYVHEAADALGISHSAASHQLGSLEVRGIVESAREGQMVRYLLAKTPEARQVMRLLKAAGQ